jgi:hypothetical protein
MYRRYFIQGVPKVYGSVSQFGVAPLYYNYQYMVAYDWGLVCRAWPNPGHVVKNVAMVGSVDCLYKDA